MSSLIYWYVRSCMTVHSAKKSITLQNCNKEKNSIFWNEYDIFSSREVKKCIFHPMKYTFFTSLDEINVIFNLKI